MIWDAFVDYWGTRCWYCGLEKRRSRRELQLDHIEPNQRDGSNDDCWNRALACMDCNGDKGDRLTLNETLKDLGMPDAFNGMTADFSGIDGRSCPGICLVVTAVVHKAFVSVDEEGTEAAAATGIGLKLVSGKPEPIRVSVDRPFIFLIQDRATDTILFLGRMELAGDALN